MMTPLPDWIRPYYEAYTDQYGQTAQRWHLTQMMKLREWDADYGDRCLTAWRHYLKLTSLQYFSVRHFTNTFDLWDNPLVTKDVAIQRAWRAGLRYVDDKSIPAGGFQSERDFKKWLDIQLAKQDEETHHSPTE